MALTRISGRPLAVLAAATRNAAAVRIVHTMMRRDLRIDQLLRLPPDLRGPVPIHNHPLRARPPRASAEVGALARTDWTGGVRELGARYREGHGSPVDVLESVLAQRSRLEMDRLDPMLTWCEERARSEAQSSAARHRAGTPLGPLDGIPYLVKEQIDVANTRRSAGAGVLADVPVSKRDGTAVARLAAAGAVLVGTTVMTEFGMTPVGANPHRRMPRNPHVGTGTDVTLAGGSSTGSGVGVASGLVPLALGVDGGGSIRIPAARTGIFGIKPTWGRISRDGDCAGGSVAHLGPLARSTYDLAAMLETMAGLDPLDFDTSFAPSGHESFTRASRRGVQGLTVGVCESELVDAEPSVQQRVREGLHELERAGAILRDVKLPMVRWAPQVGYVTIAAESLAGLGSLYFDNQDRFSSDVRLSFAALQGFSALEFLDASRLREAVRLEMQRAFREIDLLVLPSTVRAADRVSFAELEAGFSDLDMVQGLCRFMFLANLTGLPAISIPVGHDDAHMPIGMQLVGDAWDEASLLAASATLERAGLARSERPELHVRVGDR